jgi:hypothetical protein
MLSIMLTLMVLALAWLAVRFARGTRGAGA